MLIDSHCHLDDERLYPESKTIIDNLKNDGLYAVITSSSDYKTSLINYDLATKNDDVYCTVGVHPHEAKDATLSQYDEIIKLCESEKVVAIGEIGLDYYYDLSPRDVQKAELCRQLEIAHSLKLPVVFHVREAYEDFYDIIKQNKKYLDYGGVVHCYSGSKEFVKQLSPFDFYYGFDGPLTYKNARHAIESIQVIPKNRILVETDSPYLAPRQKRGHTNYPSYVKYVAEEGAKILNMSFEEFSDLTLNNTKTLYEKIK